MQENEGPNFEEVVHDDSPRPEGIEEPAQPLRPGEGARIDGQQEKKSSLPDPEPVPENLEAAKPPKFSFTKSRSSHADPTFVIPPAEEETVVKKVEVVPPPPPAENPFQYDEDDEPGQSGSGLGTALGAVALVLSVVALLLNMGIVSFGPGKETGNIAPGAVDSRELASAAVTESKVSPLLLESLQGKEGPEGKQGEPGPQGKIGPAGISSLRLVRNTTNGTASDQVVTSASCGSKEIVVSGGAEITGAEGAVAITESSPLSEFSGWGASAVQSKKTASRWSLTVFAICATPDKNLRTTTK